MAPTHLSLASTHRPSIAFFLLVLIISASIVPFLSLFSSELIPSAFPNLAYTLWDSLFGIATSSRFYFFLVNFLIVALVCSSGVLDPSSKRSDELQDGERPQNGYGSAAHVIHERLAFDEFYGSQSPTPSYLRLIERSNIYVANEIQSSDRGETSVSNQSMTKPTSDNVIFSASKMHSTNTSKIIELDVTGQAIINGSMMKDEFVPSPLTEISTEGHIADLQGEMISDAEKNINVEDMQVCNEDHDGDRINVKDMQVCNEGHDGDRPEAHEEAEDGIKSDNDASCGDDDKQNDEGYGVYDEIKHYVYDDDDGVRSGDTFQQSDAVIQRVPQSHAVLLRTQMHEMMGSTDEEGDQKESTSDEVDVGAEVRDPNESGAGSEDGELPEIDEVQMMSMSAEELNERASAFISAFRRKLVSTAIVDD